MPQIAAIPAFADNYIWLLYNERHNALVVDPGAAKPVLDTLSKHQLHLNSILITHHHRDHTGGIDELVAATGATSYGPKHEVSQAITHRLDDGDNIHLDALGIEFDILAIPGHTQGHIAFYGHGLVFCGDTLFAAGCGRLFEGTAAQLYHSLQKLAALPDDTLVYCTHEYTLANLRFAHHIEPNNHAINDRLTQVMAWRQNDQISLPSTIALEKATNPFLRCHIPAVIHTAKTVSPPIDAHDPVAVFACLRKLKDNF